MDGRIVYSHMTREMLAVTGADFSDIDSVVEYLMNTKGADVALFLYEQRQAVNDDDPSHNAGQRKIKVSMRSRGLHVGQVAASLGGGGHKMAAGCTMVGTIDDVLRQVLEILERELKAYCQR